MSIKQKIKAVISLFQPKRIVNVNFTLRGNNEYLSDKVVLVTGGGSGFGYAIAKRFLQYGAKVIITGRHVQKLQSAVASLGGVKIFLISYGTCVM